MHVDTFLQCRAGPCTSSNLPSVFFNKKRLVNYYLWKGIMDSTPTQAFGFRL
jgi:hypothetical protein